MNTPTFCHARLYDLRDKRRWSRQDLAVEYAMKSKDKRVHPETLKSWEEGDTSPGADDLAILAAIFNVSVASFYTNGG